VIADHPFVAGFVLVAVFVVIVLINLYQIRNGSPVEQWARANGYKLVSEEREVSASVRILGVPQKMMQITRIVVRDREGKTRTGHIEWTGDPLDKMHVRWDS